MSESRQNYRVITVTKRSQVATITMLLHENVLEGVPVHWELASAFNELREDIAIRVIILTGTDGQFKVPRLKENYQRAISHPSDILQKDFMGPWE